MLLNKPNKHPLKVLCDEICINTKSLTHPDLVYDTPFFTSCNAYDFVHSHLTSDAYQELYICLSMEQRTSYKGRQTDELVKGDWARDSAKWSVQSDAPRLLRLKLFDILSIRPSSCSIMSDNSSTVVASKSKFLRAQIRILSQPLQPAARRREDRGTLTESAVTEATREGLSCHLASEIRREAEKTTVNRLVRRHNQSVFSAVAVRHVAEQIDRLYWDNGAPELYDEGFDENLDGYDPTIRLGDDLSRDEAIAKLPTSAQDMGDLRSVRDSGTQFESYERTFQRLRTLSERREALQRKIDAYKVFHESVAPFKEAKHNVQPNLVTRDGPLVEEMSKSRELSVRVGARIGSLMEKENDTHGHGITVQNQFTNDDHDQRVRRAWDAQ